MKIYDVLEKGNLILKEKNDYDSNLKVKMLLAYILGVKKEYLTLNLDEEIDDEKCKIFFEKIELLKNNYPIQYIINKQSFYGLDFLVNQNVLIPQPDTEILVEEVLDYIKTLKNNENKNVFFDNNSSLNILDMCTGSGAIAISISKNVESIFIKDNVKIYASDISSLALDVARKNNDDLLSDVCFIESDLFTSIPNDIKFDVIVSNPPYIRTEVINTLPEEVKNEPHIALDGMEDGLYFYREIIKQAKEYLNKNGRIFFEIGYDQKDDVMNLFKENSYINIYSKKDYGQNDRIVVGMKGE